MIKAALVSVAMLTLAGCASQQERLAEWSRSNGSTTEIIPTSNFPIQALSLIHI